MAKVKVGKYTLESYPHGWTVYVERVSEKGNRYTTQDTYWPRLQGALTHLLDLELKDSDVETIEELLRVAKDFRQRISELLEIKDDGEGVHDAGRPDEEAAPVS